MESWNWCRFCSPVLPNPLVDLNDTEEDENKNDTSDIISSIIIMRLSSTSSWELQYENN